jgi:hypothetical protein
MEIQNDKVLYYPYFDFTFDESVKKALLYWDKIYRIVPKDFQVNDSPEIKLLVDEGLVCDLNIHQSDKENAADRFIELRNNWPSYVRDGNFEFIHTSKIDSKLLQKFQEMMTSESSKLGFVEIEESLASIILPKIWTTLQRIYYLRRKQILSYAKRKVYGCFQGKSCFGGHSGKGDSLRVGKDVCCSSFQNFSVEGRAA